MPILLALISHFSYKKGLSNRIFSKFFVKCFENEIFSKFTAKYFKNYIYKLDIIPLFISFQTYTFHTVILDFLIVTNGPSSRIFMKYFS